MIISLCDLVLLKVRILLYFSMLTRSEKLIIIHLKEYINKPPVWRRSIRKEFNTHIIFLVHQRDRRFIVCTPQYGHRDITCKRSIQILK